MSSDMDHDRRGPPVLLRPAIVCLAVAALAACGGNSTSAPPASPYTSTPSPSPGVITADDLAGRAYTSTSVDGKTLVPGTAVEVSFGQRTLAVSAGCNTFTSPYGLADGVLRWTGTPVGTAHGCSTALTHQDHWLVSTFRAGLHVTGDTTDLKLSDPTKTIHLAPKAG